MQNAASRFFCWLLAVVSMLVSISILFAPIISPERMLMDFLKNPWCIVAIFSPYALMLVFAIIRHENFLGDVLSIFLPLTALGFAILFDFASSSPNTSEKDLLGLLYFIAAFANIFLSFVVFAALISEDGGSSHSGSSGDDDDDLKWATGGEGYVDTTGLWP